MPHIDITKVIFVILFMITSSALKTPSCTCKDKISWNGHGNCRKSSEIQSGQKSCFVVLPTSCPDAVDSMTIRGEKTSVVACKKIECKTIGGPSPNTSCVFPFKHQNKVYNGCALDKDGYWCSTKVDLFGRHVGKEKNWGICGIGCPKQAMNSISDEDDDFDHDDDDDDEEVCAPGYNFKAGDIDGWGIGGSREETMYECADRCKSTNGCNSYQYSAFSNGDNCAIHRSGETDIKGNTFQDFYMCYESDISNDTSTIIAIIATIAILGICFLGLTIWYRKKGRKTNRLHPTNFQQQEQMFSNERKFLGVPRYDSEPKRFNSIYEEILEPNPVISTHSSIIRGNKYDHDLAKRTSERHAPDGSDCDEYLTPLYGRKEKQDEHLDQGFHYNITSHSMSPPNWPPPPPPTSMDQLTDYQETRKESLALPTRSPSNASSKSQKLMNLLRGDSHR